MLYSGLAARLRPLALAVAGLPALAPAARADTIHVTRTGDPQPDGCARNGCTLREAVLAANRRPRADTVLLRSGRTYRLARAGPGENSAATGDLDLLGPTTVATTRRRRATVDANLLDRAFDAAAPATLSRLVLVRAAAPGPGDEEAGGAVRSSGGELVLRRVKVVAAQHPAFASQHGAIEDTGPGAIRLVRSLVTDSELRGLSEAGGGGVRVVRSVVSGSGEEGVAETGAGGVALVRSRLVGGSQGAVYTADGGSSRIAHSLISANVDPGFEAGGVSAYDASSVTIDRTTVSANAGGPGGGGIYFPSSGTLVIRRSTVSGNEGASSGGVTAGGTVRIVNSTIAGNRSHDAGGGIHLLATATAALNAVTIARNVADTNGGGKTGGGIYVDAGGAARLDNTLLAFNSLVTAAGTPSDCDGTGVQSGGHNLRSDPSGSCLFAGPGDIVRSDPLLGPLADNGGPTRTIALKRRSPAIGRAGADAPSRDQRGVRRRDPDIGAFERR